MGIARKNILLLVENTDLCFEMEALLRVARYNVFCCHNVETAEDCFNMKSYDLLIIDGTSDPGGLDAVLKRFSSDRILAYQDRQDCREMYCIFNKTGCFCRMSVLLAAVKDILGQRGGSGNANPSCLSAVKNVLNEK